MPLTSTKPEYAFIQEGGEMGALVRAFNWSETSLGGANGWPQSLRTTLGIVLHSAFPMFLFWGTDLLCFYNDAYRPSLGTNGKHPNILGKPAKEAWPETWDFIGPLIQQVMETGQPVWFEDQLVPFYRNGQLEDVYWTFSYSPAYGDNGQINGVFVTCTETTDKVLNSRVQQETNTLLQAVINSSLSGVSVLSCVRNEQGQIIDFEYQLANRVTQRLNSQPDLAGKRFSAVHSGYKQAGLFDAFVSVVETGQTTECDRHYIGEGFDNWYATVTVKHDDGVVFSFRDITVERTAWQKIDESNDELAFAIDATELGVWDLNPLTNTFKGNTRLKDWFGLAPQADIALPMAIDVVAERDRPRVTAAIEQALQYESGGHYDAEYTIVHPTTKQERIVRAKGKARFDANQVAYRFNGTLQDITEQALAQQRIAQSQQQLLALFEQSPVGIAIISKDNLTFRMANSFYGQLVDRQLEAILDKPLLEALPELKGQGFDELLRQVIQTGVPFIANEVAVDIVRHNQLETIYVDLAYQPHYEANTISGVFVIATDVTQQVRSRQRVEASEAKLRSVVETAPVAIGLFMGRDLVVELPNQTFIDIVGKGPDIAGKPLREVMPELTTENQPFLQILDGVFTSGKQFQSFAAQVKIMKQGVMTDNYYNITYSPLFNEAGEVYAILDIAVDVTGQVLTQQELAQQKAYLQNALDIADLGTYQVNLPLNTGSYTDNIQQWFDLASVSDSMDAIFSKIHPDDRAFVEQTIADTLQTEGRSRHDITYRLANVAGKTTRYLRSIGKAIYTDGQPTTINGILQDVTPQIESRQAIESSEAKFRSLIEESPIATSLFVGREMRIELANQTMIDYWGKGPSVIGRSLIEALPELEGQPFLRQLDDVFTTGKSFETKSARADLVIDGVLGTYYFDYTYTPLRDAAGNVYAIIDTSFDVTQDVLAKRKLEETEAALRGAIDLAELVTWSLDIRKGTITYSQRFIDWLGFSEETKELDEAYTPLPAEYRESVPATMEATYQPGGSGFYENEHPIINRLTGQVRVIHAQAQVFYDDNGAPAFLSGTAQDVTEQRRIQQELERQVADRTRQLQASVLDLERSNQNLQQFAYIASHDLQEPLRKIQSFGDILKTQYAGSLGEGIDLLQRMQVSASRMSVLIKDLLTFSRISTRQETTAFVPLSQVVNSVLTDLELVIQEAGASVDTDPLPTVQGDLSQLGQLFQNLISNALKFRRTDASGVLVSPVIRIQAQQLPAADLPPLVRPTREASAYYRIDVIDNGIGFDQKYVDRIFQVFQRLHTRREFVGTGIGLAICEKVVANHGGAITATSQPGQGATFSVYLPVTVK